jgi:hypothetical protein
VLLLDCNLTSIPTLTHLGQPLLQKFKTDDLHRIKGKGLSQDAFGPPLIIEQTG